MLRTLKPNGPGIVENERGVVKNHGGIVKNHGGVGKNGSGVVKNEGRVVKNGGGVVKNEGGDFSVVIGNRGDSDACDLTACVVGTTNYQLLTTFTGKGTTGHRPGTGSAPIQIQVKAQLKRKNANYGIPSNPFVVTVIP